VYDPSEPLSKPVENVNVSAFAGCAGCVALRWYRNAKATFDPFDPAALACADATVDAADKLPSVSSALTK